MCSGELGRDATAFVRLLDATAGTLSDRWSGAGSGAVAGEQIPALVAVLDRAQRALLERVAVVAAERGTGAAREALQAAGLSFGHAERLRELARDVYGPDADPAVAQHLDDGAIRVAHAQVITETLRRVPASTREGVRQILLRTAAVVDPGTLRKAGSHAVRRAVEQAFPGELDRAAEARRQLFVSPTLDGTVDVRGTLTAMAGEALLGALEPLAQPGGDDGRTAPQRRHDALEALCTRALDAGELPEVAGERPHVQVHVDLDTLVRGGFAQLGSGSEIGSAELGRVLCDPSVVRTVLDRPHVTDLPSEIADRLPPALGGAPREVLDVGRRTRVVPPALRRALVARDRGCVEPGCTAPPSRCEVHHEVPWALGGATSLANCSLRCHRHHRAWHREHDLSPDRPRRGSP